MNNKISISSTNIKRLMLVYFGYGLAAMAAILSLFQDLLGRDGYTQFVQNHWIPSYLTVPLALTTLVLIAIVMWKNNKLFT